MIAKRRGGGLALASLHQSAKLLDFSNLLKTLRFTIAIHEYMLDVGLETQWFTVPHVSNH
jgi:hypothetical protein